MNSLHLAVISNKHYKIVNLIRNNFNPNVKNINNLAPLHLCDQKFTAKILIDNGADVNLKGHNNLTSLHLHSINGNKEIVELLLQNRAKMNEVDAFNMTAKDYALSCNHREIFEMLN